MLLQVISSSEVTSLQSRDRWLTAVCAAGECVVWTRNADSGDSPEEQWKRKITLQVATPDATPLQIHEARVVNGQLLLAYGPTGKPRIETIPLPSRNHVIIREITSKSTTVQISADAASVPVTHVSRSLFTKSTIEC